MTPKGIFRLTLLLSLLAVFGACHHTEGVFTTQLPEGKVLLTRIAILPFEDQSPENEAGKSLSCPLCGSVFYTDQNAKSAHISLEEIFTGELRGHNQFTVIDPELTREAYLRLAKSGKADPLDRVKRLGGELGADGVLVGYVFRNRERVGYWYSVEKPASLAFDVHLVRVSDGVIVWRGSFDKTQQSLMENLFQLSTFYKFGIKWVTARELAEEGVAEILKAFPGI